MRKPKALNRREFIGSAVATAATVSIVPSHVVAGSGKTPPSEKLTIANIGCGTQGIREMRHLLNNDQVQVVAVCDPNQFSTDYLDWSEHAARGYIRESIGDETWGEDLDGVPGGREVGKLQVEGFYARQTRSDRYTGCTAYEDFRELLAQEADLDAVKIMTPDHLHATISLAALDHGKHVATHKPIANRMTEARLVVNKARETDVVTHLLAWSDRPQYRLIKEWIENGAIGELREIHNWTARPVWKQWNQRPKGSMPIPDGFNWQLWLGPVPDMPYHPHYTHNVFRGWYDFGGGSVADMGHYSLFPLFETFGIIHPAVSAHAYGTTSREISGHTFEWIDNSASFPLSSMVRLHMPDQPTLPAFDLFWYDGGMKPFPPLEIESDNRNMPDEGLLFVGTEGKIMAGFRGSTPQIIPRDRMRKYTGRKSIKAGNDSYVSYPWLDHMIHRTPSPGSFVRAACVTETINLAAIAIRARHRVDYDSARMKITNHEADNAFLTREYREGWELHT